MNITFDQFKPQALFPARALYLDLIGDKEQVMMDIQHLSEQLLKLQSGASVIQASKKPIPISRANDQAINERINELKGHPVRFKTTQIATHTTSEEIVRSIEALAIQLENAGVHYLQHGLIEINDLCTLYYDDHGYVIKTLPDLGLNGCNALEVIAGVCAQDFGLVIDRDGVLIYLYGSARYEKTPKHVENGYDYFVGENFLEWHRRIPVWGPSLARLFERMYSAFKQNHFDLLLVDLKGRHLYTDGNLVVRRYERDYALPLLTQDGETVGMTVFADSFFKNINDELRPFFGGKHLVITSPREFYDHFHAITHNAFRHHPFGMRDENGVSPCLKNT